MKPDRRHHGSGLPASPARHDPDKHRDTLVGVACALLAVAIWSGWIVNTRHAVTGDISPEAVALSRFIVPAVFLAPAYCRLDLAHRLHPLPSLFCFLGSGATFALASGYAMRFVPATDAGPLLSGSIPLAAAAIGVIFLRETVERARWTGLGLIALGAITLAGRNFFGPSDDHAWLGQTLLLASAFMWATHTLAFPHTGASAATITGLISMLSAVVLLPYGIPGILNALEAGKGHDIVKLLLVQGAGSGLIAPLAFGTAIARLGPRRASAFPGLVPALAAVMAMALLGENLDIPALLGILASSVGVFLASGIKPGKSNAPATKAP